MIWFTSDEHYNHQNILKYCKRPFFSISNMNEELIKRHNEIVSKIDVTYHLGDFTLSNKNFAESIISQLNGKHIFIQGSHDYWLKHSNQIYEIKVDNQQIVLCHYAMLVWPKSHYGSWQLFGHSHGGLSNTKVDNFLRGKQMDVGVDTNNFYPYSFDQIKEIMKTKPDNFNLVKK